MARHSLCSRLRVLLVALVGPPVLGWAGAAAADAPVQLAEPGRFVQTATAAAPDGSYLIVWQDRQSRKLRAQPVSPAGFPLESFLDLPAVAVNSGLVAQIVAAFSADGSWIVAWTQDSDADQIGVGGAVFDPRHQLVRTFVLPDPIPDPGGLVTGFGPQVAALPGGGFALAWVVGIQEDPLGDPLIPTELDIYVARLDETGAQVGPAVRVHDDTEGRQRVTAIGASDAGIVVTWDSLTPGSGNERETRVRVLELDLTPASADVRVNESPIPNALPRGFGRSDLAVAPDGRFLVIWEGESAPGGGTDVRVRAFEADGEPAGGEEPVGDPRLERYVPVADVSALGVAWLGWIVVDPTQVGDEEPPAQTLQVRPYDPTGTPLEPARNVVASSLGERPEMSSARQGALVTWRPGDGATVVGQVIDLPLDEALPPEELALESPELPGFRVWVRIRHGSFDFIWGTEARPCLPEALCAAGALPDRAEVIVRVVGPKPNGRLWPTLVKLSTSQAEVWIEQLSTGAVQSYLLAGTTPGGEVLPGLFDRDGFEP